jgi:hypothetical protein
MATLWAWLLATGLVVESLWGGSLLMLRYLG